MTSKPTRTLAAVMFADMVGFTALMGQDEDAAREHRDRQREVVERLVAGSGGQVRQFYGDGTLSLFGSAVEAARCAVAIQAELRRPLAVSLRIGIHLGDVVDEGDGVYGDGVNLASRVESLAPPGGVLVSDRVHDQIKNHPDLGASSLGAVQLKNVARPVEIFALTASGLPVPEPFRSGGIRGFFAGLKRRHLKRDSGLGEPTLKSQAPPPATRPSGSERSWRRLSAAAIMIAVAASATAWFFYERTRVQWAREVALPEIEALIAQERLVEAVSLGEEAERHLGDDPALAGLWPRMARTMTITSIPPGASVSLSAVQSPSIGSEVQVDRPEVWRELGNAPIDVERLPLGSYRLRFAAPGFDTVEDVYVNPYDRNGRTHQWRTMLHAAGTVPSGMARIEPRNLRLNLYGVSSAYDPTPDRGLDSAFLIGKFEVTNREYQAFVDAGGYGEPAYWENEFVTEQGVLSWEQAMAEFRDRSRRPGPSTWDGGTYPDGQGDYPVTGVSWYEAAAYAHFAGASLPTLFHWTAAAENRGFNMAGFGNFRGSGAGPVGATPFGPYGIHDLAGNVREWVWNSAGSTRYVVGGGWSDPHYVFGHAGHAPAFDRSPSNGFRLARFAETSDDELAMLRAPVERETSFVWDSEPVGDEAFAALARRYDYDSENLDPRLDAVDDRSRYWRKETVSFNAAYDDERVFGYLFLPKGAEPPFQTLIYFPGVAVMLDRSSERLDGEAFIEYVVKSGRAVLYPVYKDTYERYAGVGQNRNATREYVERKTHWIQDVRRSIDYLATRNEIDEDRIGYWGLSWGAEHAPIALATDPRLVAGVLMDGGAVHVSVLPEADESHFASRATQPVLMINGRYDYIFPVETAQRPLFELFGTPDEDKTHLLYDAGHVAGNRFFEETMAAMVSWLDRYLGPVG